MSPCVHLGEDAILGVRVWPEAHEQPPACSEQSTAVLIAPTIRPLSQRIMSPLYCLRHGLGDDNFKAQIFLMVGGGEVCLVFWASPIDLHPHGGSSGKRGLLGAFARSPYLKSL